MATMGVSPDMNGFRVIHPLDDVAEQKCSTEGLGKIRITRAVRVSLGVLRGLPDFDDADARLPRPRSLRSSEEDPLSDFNT